MMLLVYLLVLTGVLCCTAAPAADIPQGHCKVPPNFDDKVLQGDCNAEHYAPGTLAVYTCRPGFSYRGSIRYICAEGIWEALASNRECTKITCQKPTVRNGKILESKDYYSFQETVTLECNKGYVIVDTPEDPTRTCTSTGWSPSLQCIKDSCETPAPLQYGRIKDSKETYKHGEKVTFECLEDYTLSGDGTAVCSTGQWLNIPTCVYSSCEQPPGIKNGQLRDQKKLKYKTSEKASYVCNQGYSVSKSGAEVTCENKVWTTPKECRRIGEKCGSPPVVQNGDIKGLRKLNYDSGSSVEYQCANLYILEGNNRIKCEDGEWEKAPICREPCTVTYMAMEKNNIQLAYKGDKTLYSEHLDHITFSCKPGYYEPSSTTNLLKVQCIDGVMLLPKCSKPGIGEKCGSPPVVQNGDIKGLRKLNYDSGSSVEYQCANLYILEGNNRIKCEDGEWEKAPICREPCTVTYMAMEKNNIQLAYKGDKTLYSEHLDHITFSCKPGYYEPSSTTNLLKVQCIDGVMLLPKCSKPGIGEKCGSPPVVQNGDIKGLRKLNYDSGSSVEYQCANLYILEGNNRIKCEDGEWEKAPICREPCTVTYMAMEKNNIQLAYKGDKTLYSEHLDHITFSCKPGYYEPSSTTNLLKVQCIDGVMLLPKCSKPGSCVLQDLEMMQRNILYSHSHEIGNGETIEFECTEGTLAEGKLEAKCDNGNINYPNCVYAPPCVLQEDEMDASNIKYDESTKQIRSGQTIIFTCAEGMIEEKEESLVATCINGNIKYPKCVIPKPCSISDSILEEKHIELVSPEDQSKIFQHDETVIVKCRTNYKHPGSVHTKCFNGMVRSQKCFDNFKSLCRIIQNQIDDNFLELNEKYNDDTYYEEGDIVRFKCKTGYSADNELTATCTKPRRPASAPPVLNFPVCIKKSDS
ncbi:coagulation factor XIII B chain-like isoform X2 [Hyperolius riggenbachi]|uniref:coagulation factor XIII B chain-like isoform X2 n=1 Tax=Hyperolius riggenbachi TaxID=752182 RepID=UPI0035A38F4A